MNRNTTTKKKNYFYFNRYIFTHFCSIRNYEKYFVKAMKVRRLIADDFNNVWSKGIHILLTPTTLTTAPLLSDFMLLDNRAQCSAQDYCTQPANMAGELHVDS